MRARAAAYPLWKRGNEMDQTIAFLGGDARMRLLAQMMAAEGYDVCSWELTGAPNERALCDALKADIIVLPLPAEKNGYLSGTELTMESLLRSLRCEHRIFAGNVGNDASTLAQLLGLTITDYFASEELSVRNAIPTAEGAIEAAMKHTSVTLHGTPCLVLGFGRIGKVLAHDLSALGAKVSVSARKRSDLAWIDAFGYAPLHTNRLSGTLGEFRVVFNTVPHQVLDETLLAELPPDCLLIELASASGFSLYNALAALCAVQALGVPLSDAAKALTECVGVKGRCEVVPLDAPFTVIIDYAHTPDGLKNILSTVCGFADGRVIALFGCGGDRDKTKRPRMGRIAAALSDFVVLTSDNPRTEDPYTILRDVLPAILESRTPFAVIENRREAIGFALREAKARDVVVLCGKGHETYQEIGTIKYHLDEREVVRERFAQVQRKDAADAAKENEHEDHHCLHTELRGLRDHGKISGP